MRGACVNLDKLGETLWNCLCKFFPTSVTEEEIFVNTIVSDVSFVSQDSSGSNS